MNRAVGAIALAASCLLAAPAEAVEYGGWYARLTLDSWHDDNLARQSSFRPDRFPRGNQDFGADAGLSLGSVFVLDPRFDLWITGSARASRAVLYPEWSGAAASLYGDLAYHWNADTEAYLAAGASRAWAGSPFYSAELGLERRLWPGGRAHAAAGYAEYLSDRPALSYHLPNASVGFRQSFPTGTRLGLSYGYQQRMYQANRTDPQHQLFGIATQRLFGRFELRARYAYTLATSASAGFRNGFLSVGLAYDL